MANDNHLFSVTLYNVTMISNKYYNEFFELGQQKINFKFFELSLPDDDPVYTLKKSDGGFRFYEPFGSVFKQGKKRV